VKGSRTASPWITPCSVVSWDLVFWDLPFGLDASEIIEMWRRVGNNNKIEPISLGLGVAATFRFFVFAI